MLQELTRHALDCIPTLLRQPRSTLLNHVAAACERDGVNAALAQLPFRPAVVQLLGSFVAAGAAVASRLQCRQHRDTFAALLAADAATSLAAAHTD
ncbi:MAG: hypothetical protein AAF334_01550 [Pseudomonadota bacterium]